MEVDILGSGSSGVLNAQSGNNDLLVFSGGAVTLSGATLSLHSTLPVTSGTWAAGSAWKLINWSGVSGTFDSITDMPDLSSLGLSWDWSQLYSSGTVSVIAAPEPSRGLLLMAGLALPLVRRRRETHTK
jgi:fibronectin-binding autotransporter adhesin